MRVAFIGCLHSSRALLTRILTLPDVEVVGVATRATSGFNADFCSLEATAFDAGISCFIDTGNRQKDMAAWLASLSPDVIYCIGWPYLLRPEVLGIPPHGVIGYHPTALPQNRGRHPIIWTLALGLTETASSFFFMDEGADSGDLVSQRKLSVTRGDDAGSLYARLVETALRQVEEFTPLLATGMVTRIPQDASRASSWRKRSKSDGRIDWRMPAEGIFNLVRSLSHPYPGADCIYENAEVKIWRCQVRSEEYPTEQLSNVEPGRVLASTADGVDVRCGTGVVRLTSHSFTSLPPLGVAL